ncbi:serine/arginine repetitive matrix protein 4 [Python bivittatus]|uniref:Serine/arginine repetitive matrix protein 4 n=1 Tax=Python bivittatus TaxID=176946 RepID=A0A9F5IY21_PYTBI|nr:serine/arginine repetitive matrix protein 4 [Python bivittatus]
MHDDVITHHHYIIAFFHWSSRSRPQKSRRHHHRSTSDSTNSLSESYGSRLRTKFQDEGRKGRPGHSRHSSKRTSHPDDAGELAGSPFLGCTLQNNYFLSTTELISNSGSAAGLFKKAAGQLGNRIKQNGDPHEYDSGNATSSPPSIQTSTSRSKGSQEARGQTHNGFARAFSSGKASSVSSPDSGNSFRSYSSQSKGPTLEEPSPSPLGLCKDQNGEVWPSLEPLGKKKASFVSPPFSSSPLQPCLRNESPSSRSSLDSSQSDPLRHKAGRRSSPSRSCCSSETRFSSRSPSYSPKSCKRATGSRISRSRRSPSYSQYRAGRGREQDHNYGSSRKESHRHQDRRRRKQSYSPMRKRRRDSPSHLEARRITSARKRPIPYYRPSPSSSSPSSSSVYSSGHSCLSYSPARSRSYSSDRSSCSRSWSSNAQSSRSRSSGGRSSPRSSSRSSASTGSHDSLRHS